MCPKGWEYNHGASGEPMSRNIARKYREEMPEPEGKTPSDRAEDLKESRRWQLAEVLSHQGKIELDIDPEKLAELRSTR
jgi:hypothetical protein